MFLTRFSLNPVRRGARKLLGSPQAMHAAVLAGFPEQAGTERGRVLWRVDTDEHRVTLYIVSPDKPDLTHLVEQAGWPTTETWLTRPYEGVLKRVAPGQRWGFRLTANPVRVLAPEPGEKRGKRVGHVTPAQQQEWLISQGAKHGFALPTIPDERDPERERVRGLQILGQSTRKFDRQGRSVSIKMVTFEGELSITDAEAFCAVLTHGIGPAKGYGCGLLTIVALD